MTLNFIKQVISGCAVEFAFGQKCISSSTSLELQKFISPVGSAAVNVGQARCWVCENWPSIWLERVVFVFLSIWYVALYGSHFYQFIYGEFLVFFNVTYELTLYSSWLASWNFRKIISSSEEVVCSRFSSVIDLTKIAFTRPVQVSWPWSWSSSKSV